MFKLALSDGTEEVLEIELLTLSLRKGRRASTHGCTMSRMEVGRFSRDLCPLPGNSIGRTCKTEEYISMHSIDGRCSACMDQAEGVATSFHARWLKVGLIFHGLCPLLGYSIHRISTGETRP
jgi:hypothetical protein